MSPPPAATAARAARSRPARRISGPARPASRSPVRAMASGAAALRAPAITAPARLPRPRPGVRRRVPLHWQLSSALARALRLAGERVMGRLSHGRTWIGIVAFALIGIVSMQLWLLKLNTGIGRALVHEATLQRENAALSIEDSNAASWESVEAHASRLSMVSVSPTSLRFHRYSRADVGLAASALRSDRPSSSLAASASTLAGAPAAEAVSAPAGSVSAESTAPSEPSSTATPPASTQATPAEGATTTAAPSTEAASAPATAAGGAPVAGAPAAAEAPAPAQSAGAGGGTQVASGG